MTNYRCPRCSSMHSVNVDKIFDGRLIFKCSNCGVCAVVSSTYSAPSSPLLSGAILDEAYLVFLDLYDGGHITDENDFRLLAERERIIRPAAEVKSLLAKYNAEPNELITSILNSQQDYVVDYQIIDESPPEPGGSVEDLPVDSAITNVLLTKGIDRIYKFQEEAIKQVLLGNDLAIVAPTASGKTEAFCIPVLQKIVEETSHFGSLRSPHAKNMQKGQVGAGKISALFAYPTKALARDQMPKIKDLAESVGLRIGILDGDTAQADRNLITSIPPDIIITNFDTLHHHMIHRTKFSRMIRTVKYLIVDEAHTYTGVFGANVHHIVKRIERLLPVAQAKLQIIAASATLPNAGEFCQLLFGRKKMDVVHGKGRSGRIHFAILFPSLRSHRSLMLELMKKTTRANHKTITFSGSHLGAELVAFYASRQGVKTRVHRAGLLPAVRKEVESSFKTGQIMSISSTPTLELGIDIGDVDAIISNIVPINRLVQRFGRAARRGQVGYAFLVLSNDPISQYYKMHPDDYLADSEYAYTDPANPFVQEYQVLAMACDRPLSMQESAPLWKTVQKLVSRQLLKLDGNRFLPTSGGIELLQNYSIRGIGGRVDIVLDGKIMGDRALPQALEELHQGAVYFMSGRRYQVKLLHFTNEQLGYRRTPYAELTLLLPDYPYFTKAITDEWPSILEVHEKKLAFNKGVEIAYCSLQIRKRVLGFANIELGLDTLQGRKVILDNPLEYEFVTKGFVFRAPRPFDISKDAQDEEYVDASSYHASEHVLIEGSALITGGASQDLGGISLSSGLIFVYDGSIGGNGASRVLYERIDKSFARALRILSECQCKTESGCPRCTYSYRCGNTNEYLHKSGAIEVLSKVIEGERTEIGETIAGNRTFV